VSLAVASLLFTACSTTRDRAPKITATESVSIVIRSILPHHIELYLDSNGLSYVRQRIEPEKEVIDRFNEVYAVAVERMPESQVRDYFDYFGITEYLTIEERDSRTAYSTIASLRERIAAMAYREGDPRAVEDGMTITCVFFEDNAYSAIVIENNHSTSQREIGPLLRQVWPTAEVILRKWGL